VQGDGCTQRDGGTWQGRIVEVNGGIPAQRDGGARGRQKAPMTSNPGEWGRVGRRGTEVPGESLFENEE
jgi:hypothetical protein